MVTTTPASGVAVWLSMGDMCDGAIDVSAKAAKLRFADDPTVKRIPLHAATQLLVATHTRDISCANTERHTNPLLEMV
jgi:hypothetical protein